MPRPCLEDHPPSPASCRVCRWCHDDSDLGAFHRLQWGEPEPNGALATAYPPREIVPGLLDPIPDPELRPVPEPWPNDPRVMRRHRDALRHLAHADMPSPGPREGRGVLMVGGGKYWPGIVVAVKMLRDTGSTLPVQIWHRGVHEPVCAADLVGLGPIEIHDLTEIRPAPRALNGWEAKTVAILACGWERLFFLDADAYFLSDPTPLLDRLSAAEPFLYWEDHPFAHLHMNWSAWNLPGSSVPPIQGGQFAIHVRLFWRHLLLAYWLDQHSDFSYAHQYGDQDSWRVALTVASGRYTCLDDARFDEIAFICHIGGKPVVVHRYQGKMFYPEHVTAENKNHTNRRHDGLPSEARAWAHFESLLSARPGSV